MYYGQLWWSKCSTNSYKKLPGNILNVDEYDMPLYIIGTLSSTDQMLDAIRLGKEDNYDNRSGYCRKILESAGIILVKLSNRTKCVQVSREGYE